MCVHTSTSSPTFWAITDTLLSRAQQTIRHSPAPRSYSRSPTVIDLTAEDDCPTSMGWHRAASLPFTTPTRMDGPFATPNKRRQRQVSCLETNENEEEPRKRTRRAACKKSQSSHTTTDSPRNESPIPLVQSDLGVITCPRARRARQPSRKWLESHYDEADGAGAPFDNPVQSSTRPSRPGSECGQDDYEGGEVQALKSRIAELEQEKNEYRDKSGLKEAKIQKQGEQLLLLNMRKVTASEEVIAGAIKGCLTGNTPDENPVLQSHAVAINPHASSNLDQDAAIRPGTVDGSISAEAEAFGDQAEVQPHATQSM